MRRLGVAEDCPAEVVAALRREDPARVVPLALATLCALVCSFGGGRVSPDEFLEDWGVISPDEAADRAAQEAMDNLRILAERRKRNGIENIG